MRRALAALAPIVCGALLQSCARAPALRVAEVGRLDAPSGIILQDRWSSADSARIVVRRQGSPGDTRTVELRAMTDRRAISFLALWRDDIQSADPRLWTWDAAAGVYRLRENESDRFAFFWPLGEGSDLRFFAARPASYDFWLWRAGWTDLAGVADDQRLDVEAYPAQAEAGGAPLYPSDDDGFRVAHRWTLDPGLAGVAPTVRPGYRREAELPGAAAQDASGSVADVKARSLYKVDYSDQPPSWFVTGVGRTPGSWFGADIEGYRQGFWVVEFHRTLATADKANDIQFNVPGPRRFAIAVSDGDAWDQRYVSGPIELVLPD